MMSNWSATDQTFMARAIDVGRQNLGATGTNPSVGCVIVKDGVILSEGVTSPGGRPHAERNALGEAGEAARGATAYVTLEPCSHFGKTPPCANALIEAGIARTVVAVDDPDPRVSGNGYHMLRAAGIAVETGLLGDDAKRGLNGYLSRQVRQRPYVILKLALSQDGMIGRLGEGQVAITGAQTRRITHQLRAESDAILVGIGTALADDPELTVRTLGLEARSPLRIVIDKDLRLPLESKLAKSAKAVPVLLVSSDANNPALADRRAALEALGVEVMEEGDLCALMARLADGGISQILVEGGAATARSFLDAGLVDRILLFEGPITIGDRGLESPLTRQNIPEGYALVAQLTSGDDVCFDYERPF